MSSATSSAFPPRPSGARRRCAYAQRDRASATESCGHQERRGTFVPAPAEGRLLAEHWMPSMSRVDVIDQLLANNRTRSSGLKARHLDLRPTLRLTIVTCMDSRLDVFAALGLEDGQAHILRNAGGVVTDDVVRSLAISQRLLRTEQVMVIHHTDCGMEKITDDGFRAELQADTGMAPSFAIESFTNVEADVRQSVARLRHSSFLPHRDRIRGFVYDVDTHGLSEIACP
jgi:carbonic anhydrase